MSAVTITGGKLDSIGNVKLNDDHPIRVHTGFCHWAPPQFTDKGQTVLHTILSVVSLAVALWSAGEQVRIFRMREKLADGYAAIAEEEWRRFNEKYRPLENDMIAECLAEDGYAPDYGAAETEYRGLADAGLEGARAAMDDLAARYALCIDRSLLSGLVSEAAASSSDFVNYGYRDAEWYARNKSDYRFNRRSNLLNLGRNLLSQSAKYGGLANQILQSAGQAAAATTAGAMQFLGYIRNRNETFYPEYVTGGVPSPEPGTSRDSYPVVSAMGIDTTVG